jgi:hypothetical protein
MKPNHRSLHRLLLLVAGLLSPLWPAARGQISPSEVQNPQLRALEAKYLQDLISLNRQIVSTHFSFPFVTGRFVDVDPEKQPESDTRGLEFVRFQERVLLKCSGNYNAALSADRLTRNQRASRVFEDVVAPVVKLLSQKLSKNEDFDGFGLEVSYHVREANGSYNFEGRENLVVVLSRADALRLPQLTSVEDEQALLNNSEIYVNGDRYGLALGRTDAYALAEISPTEPSEAAPATPLSRETVSRGATTGLHIAGLDLRATPPIMQPAGSEVSTAKAPAPSARALTQAEVDALQDENREALEGLGKFAVSSLHGVEYDPPGLALFRDALYLQLTVRNPESFDKEKTSLYKRAALSFDTFLAPRLKDLLAKLPEIPGLVGLNITVLTQFSAGGSSAEAVEFVCPLAALRQLATYEISNQDLINQSLVIVNGVRISLNLQQVE